MSRIKTPKIYHAIQSLPATQKGPGRRWGGLRTPTPRPGRRPKIKERCTPSQSGLTTTGARVPSDLGVVEGNNVVKDTSKQKGIFKTQYKKRENRRGERANSFGGWAETKEEEIGTGTGLGEAVRPGPRTATPVSSAKKPKHTLCLYALQIGLSVIRSSAKGSQHRTEQGSEVGGNRRGGKAAVRTDRPSSPTAEL